MPSLAPEDGVATCPYRLQAEDFEQDGLIIQKGTYNVVWDAADNVPSEVREQLSGEMQTIVTNDDGACAMHSIYGRPNARGELFVDRAREKAAALLQTLPERANACGTGARQLENLHTCLWADMVVPHLEGNGSPEASMFWKTLSEVTPALALEARACHAQRPVFERNFAEAKRRAVVASRSFFTAANLRSVREVACMLGYIPTTAVFSFSSGRPRLLETSINSEDAGAEGLRSCSSDGFVKGTREALPLNEPNCKFAALFDPSPVFDGLRETFMVFGDPGSTVNTLHRILSELHATEANHEFVVALRAWCATPAPLREPHDFGPRAWNAYLACLRKRDYYFLWTNS